MRLAALSREAWITDWPMPPALITTTVSPGCTLARLSTAAPVTTARMRHGFERHLLRDDDRAALRDHGALGEHTGVGELEGLLRRG